LSTSQRYLASFPESKKIKNF